MARPRRWPSVERATVMCRKGSHWACRGTLGRARDHEDKPRCECPCHWAAKSQER